MKKILVTLAILLSLGATSVAQAQDGGAIIGAVVGGVIGNQVGRGNGNIAATAIGAGLGAVIGDRMSRPSYVYSSQTGGYRTQPRPVYRDRPVYSDQQYGDSQGSYDSSVLDEYNRGRADKALADHNADLRRAYDYGRGTGSNW